MSLNDKTIIRFFQSKGSDSKAEKTQKGINAEIFYKYKKYKITLRIKRLDKETYITYKSRSKKTRRSVTKCTYGESIRGLSFKYFYDWSEATERDRMREVIINEEKKWHDLHAKEYGRSDPFVILGENVNTFEDEVSERFSERSKNNIITEEQYKSAPIELAEGKYYEECDYWGDEPVAGEGDRTFPNFLACRVRDEIALFEASKELRENGVQFKIFQENHGDYALLIETGDGIKVLRISAMSTEGIRYNLSKTNGMLDGIINTSEDMFHKRNISLDISKLLTTKKFGEI